MGGFGVVDEGGIGRRLWIKSKNKSVFSVYTPFVVCLASGKLDLQSFLHCLSQHLLFLQASVRAYEMAEECADDDEDKSVIRKLKKRALKQLQMYRTIAQEQGFELPKQNTSDIAMAKYTDFLLATALGKTVGGGFLDKIATPFERTKLAAYAIAAMAPSMRLHAFLSKEIQAGLDPKESNHIYKKWISSQKFEGAACQIEGLLEKLTISLTSEELEVVEKLYSEAIKLEVDFFSAQPTIQQAIVPLSRAHGNAEHNVMLFCDFDAACSAIDSSALLAEIAIIKASKVNNLNDLKSTWSTLSSQFVEGYEQCIESIMLGETVKEFNYGSLCKALDQLSDFEKRANSKVVESGVLKGLHIEDVKWAGEHLVFRDGCRDFIQAIIKNKDLETDVHILSYGWSGDLIKSAFMMGNLHVQSVSSNELLYDGLTTTGDMLKKVESPMEKLRAFNDICKGSSNKDEKLSVYIGGSVGDLLCLLEADVGIVISPSKNLKRLGNQFGITFVPLFSDVVKKQRELVQGGSHCWKGQSGILYTVSSWTEIHAFILGS